MGIFRSYFSKNTGLIKQNLSNNSLNPVHELFYGGDIQNVSRFIFDINLDNLKVRLINGNIGFTRVYRHTLHLTNTIANTNQYVGGKSYSSNIQRASGFQLDLFTIAEDWDSGSGYDFVYDDSFLPKDYNTSPANWNFRKTNFSWKSSGAYYTGTTGTSFVIASQTFPMGNEDINIDVTDYINTKLAGTIGSNYGLGLKFKDEYEVLKTDLYQAVGFFTKYTNTVYEPYIETYYDDIITDDRNFFYLDKENSLYLYASAGNQAVDLTVNRVTIYDYEDNAIQTILEADVVNVTKGVYKINLTIDSLTYPDAVIFRDVWNVTINGVTKDVEQKFYVISQDNYYTFDLSNRIDVNNYNFNFYGINDNETITGGDIKKIRLKIRELYPNQNNNVPFDLKYRVYFTTGKDIQTDVIPNGTVSRTSRGYEFSIDTSWLLPQDYFLEIKMNDGNTYVLKNKIKFTVVSSDVYAKDSVVTYLTYGQITSGSDIRRSIKYMDTENNFKNLFTMTDIKVVVKSRSNPSVELIKFKKVAVSGVTGWTGLIYVDDFTYDFIISDTITSAHPNEVLFAEVKFQWPDPQDIDNSEEKIFIINISNSALVDDTVKNY